MPNFGYKLLTKRAKSKTPHANFDLHTVQHSINAAEPVDHRTIFEFLEHFSSFPKESMMVSYGLAENTVYVCSGGKNVIYPQVERSNLNVRVEVRGVDYIYNFV